MLLQRRSTTCTRRNVHASENPLCVHIPFSPRLLLVPQAPPAPVLIAATPWGRRRTALYVCLRSRPPWMVSSSGGALLVLRPPFPPFFGGLPRRGMRGDAPSLPWVVSYEWGVDTESRAAHEKCREFAEYFSPRTLCSGQARA